MVHSKRASLFVLAALVGSSMAMPMKREVPQEHSHNPYLATTRTFLNQNNPDGIVDPVFGLLGNAAAEGGIGKITDVACLQQATADRAFTNAKAAKSVDGQVGALVYRALERNTPGVGVASALCTSIKAVNPEIAAISQHQDPASPGAAATNKAIVLALAKQIKAVGGNPLTALDSGTFKPGNLNDNTGKGNTCDTADDLAGCIFSQNLLVDDATPAEISAAVGGVAASQPAATKASSAVAAAATTAAAASSGKLNFGKCTNPSMSFGFGFPGRKATEASFEPTDLAQFNHGTALNPNIIMQFICDNLVNSCGLNNANASVIACRAAQVKADTNGEHGVTADVFNGLLGFKTNFAAVEAAGPAGGSAATTAAPAAAAATTAAATTAAAAASSGKGKLSFGTCTDPTIKFGAGLDGRQATEFSFINNNQKQFPHGSALNVKVIADFTCTQFVNGCGLKNGDPTIAACQAASTAAQAFGKNGAAADSFNKALGFTTNFAAVKTT